MSETMPSFVVKVVDWNYEQSREMGTQSPQAVRAGPRLVSIGCTACGATWIAREGWDRGDFRNVIGGILVNCTECPAEGQISLLPSAQADPGDSANPD